MWRLSCLARNGRKPRGRKSHQRRCGSDDRGAAGLRPDQAIKEATCVRVLNRNLGRRRGESRLSCTRGRNGSAQKEKQSAAKGGVVREVMIISGALHRPGYAGLAEMSAALLGHFEEDCPLPAQVPVIPGQRAALGEVENRRCGAGIPRPTQSTPRPAHGHMRPATSNRTQTFASPLRAEKLRRYHSREQRL